MRKQNRTPVTYRGQNFASIADFWRVYGREQGRPYEGFLKTVRKRGPQAAAEPDAPKQTRPLRPRIFEGKEYRSTGALGTHFAKLFGVTSDAATQRIKSLGPEEAAKRYRNRKTAIKVDGRYYETMADYLVPLAVRTGTDLATLRYKKRTGMTLEEVGKWANANRILRAAHPSLTEEVGIFGWRFRDVRASLSYYEVPSVHRIPIYDHVRDAKTYDLQRLLAAALVRLAERDALRPDLRQRRETGLPARCLPLNEFVGELSETDHAVRRLIFGSSPRGNGAPD